RKHSKLRQLDRIKRPFGRISSVDYDGRRGPGLSVSWRWRAAQPANRSQILVLIWIAFPFPRPRTSPGAVVFAYAVNLFIFFALQVDAVRKGSLALLSLGAGPAHVTAAK